MKLVRKKFRVWYDRQKEAKWCKNKRIISCLEDLSTKPGWDVDKAINYFDQLKKKHFRRSLNKLRESRVFSNDQPLEASISLNNDVGRHS